MPLSATWRSRVLLYNDIFIYWQDLDGRACQGPHVLGGETHQDAGAPRRRAPQRHRSCRGALSAPLYVNVMRATAGVAFAGPSSCIINYAVV